MAYINIPILKESILSALEDSVSIDFGSSIITDEAGNSGLKIKDHITFHIDTDVIREKLNLAPDVEIIIQQSIPAVSTKYDPKRI